MGSYTAVDFCNEHGYTSSPYFSSPSGLVNLTNLDAKYLVNLCDAANDARAYESNSEREGRYSSPMELIGIYISIASLFCILAMALDLMNGFRIRKFWFPTKYFSLNAASITVVAVAMKLPVDLTSPMQARIDQVGKVGSLAFMCTIMSNLMPSLASMDNKSLLANVTGLSILVITVIVNTFIQIRTHVISPETFYFAPFPIKLYMVVAYIYMGMLLFLLIILISSAIAIPPSKKILEIKYQAISKTIVIDQHHQENPISTLDKLREVVKSYWIMAQTGSPQFVIASNPLSSASGIICALSMLMYVFVVVLFGAYQSALTSQSVYKNSMLAIAVAQSIGVVVGSIAPRLRCFTVLSVKSFSKQIRNHFLVFKVDKYWTQKLSDWKESRISFLASGRRSRAILHNLKNRILWFCIGFQKLVVVSCKIIGLPPIVVIIFFVYVSRSVKRMLFSTSTASSSVDTNEDLSKYVLLIEDNAQLAKRTLKRISDSMNRLIQKAVKKQHKSLLKLLEQSVEKSVRESAASNGVVTFDNDQFQSLLPVEHVNSWSLPIISLTCIAVVIPEIRQHRVDNLFKSVGEGLLYTHLVEESLNTEPMYVNIRRATVTLWNEVEETYKWLDTTLERNAYERKNSKKPKDVAKLGSAYKGKNSKSPRDIIKLFADSAEKILNEFTRNSNGERVENENLPRKVIAANSMYRIAKTIMHTYESNDMAIVEDELFTRLSSMIADILVACLTNIPRAIAVRCYEEIIEKREASVAAAIDLLGRTTKIIEKLERHVPNMNQDKMAYIDEWRIHLRQP